MPKIISSLTNPRVKNVLHLRRKSYRKKNNLILVEGVREVTRALEKGIGFAEIYLCLDHVESNKEYSIFQQHLKKQSCDIFQVSSKVMDKMAYGDRHDGVIGVCSPIFKALDDLACLEDPLYVIVDNVEKPGNLGAILRTCDAVGVDAVLMCNGKADIFSPNVIRASVGSVFTNVVVQASAESIFSFLQERHISIAALMPQAKDIYSQCRFPKALAVVLGGEHEGVSGFWQKKSNHHMRLPMKGHCDSLNVSVSTGIVLYEILRQREAS